MQFDITMGGLYAVIHAGVLYDTRLRPAAKLLYGELNRLAQSSGYCYATNKQLTGVCGLSVKTVSELVNQLRDCGHIRVEMVRRYGTSGDVVQRRIYVGVELAKCVPEIPGETPAEGIPKNPETSPEKSGGGIPKNPEVIRGIKNTRYIPPLPPTQSDVQKEIQNAIDTYIGDDPEYRDAFDGFLENRKALHKPVKTVYAINRILNRLRKVHDRKIEIAMLDKAVEYDWLTVYTLKPDELPEKSSEPAEQEAYGWED